MLAHDLVAAWQQIFTTRAATLRPKADGPAAIHHYDPIDDFAAWSRCRDRARFHLGRARRAKDRGQYRAAAREIERALRYDDTSESYFQVLGQCYLNNAGNLPAGSEQAVAVARWALEQAFALNPRNGYTIKLLLRVYQEQGNPVAARQTLQRALAAGAPAAIA